MSTTEEIYRIAAANRVLAADMFAGLDDEQWRTPSLCEGWTVREVAAHLVPLKVASRGGRWCATYSDTAGT